jgi:hypothetical protein
MVTLMGGRDSQGYRMFLSPAKALRTDVDNMTLPVDHDIAIVSILDLQNIASDRDGQSKDQRPVWVLC